MNFIGLIFIFTVTSSAVGHRRHYPGTGTNKNVQDGEDEYGNRGGWHNGRAAAAQNCSTSTSVNSYCDQVLESLLSLVVGVPDSNNITNNSFSEILSKSYPNQISANATQKDKEKSNIQRQGIAENSNVTQICCFLMNFQSAWENCCTQISTFCEGVDTSYQTCGNCFQKRRGWRKYGRHNWNSNN